MSDRHRAQRALIQDAHSKASTRGKNSYTDPFTGYMVMTAFYLKARGECCGSGCRHCPFSPERQEAAGRPTFTNNERPKD
jgi:hypothetical protein